jgi:hypothetical protein
VHVKTNGTRTSELSKEVIDQYFSLKIVEARNENNEPWLKLLNASQRRWEADQQVHLKLAMDIAEWHARTLMLNDLAEADPYTPSLRDKLTATLLLHRTALSGLVCTAVLTMALAIQILIALTSASTEVWFSLSVTLVSWAFVTYRTYEDWRN